MSSSGRGGRDSVRLDRLLWLATLVAMGLLFVAYFLPVRPLVWVFPIWSVPVFFTIAFTVAVAYAAVRLGWPREGSA